MEKSTREGLVKALAKIVGEKHVCGNDVTRWTYAIEDFGGSFFHPTSEKYGAPDLVAVPHTTAEVSAIVKLANKKGVPIIARGGGHDMTGAATP